MIRGGVALVEDADPVPLLGGEVQVPVKGGDEVLGERGVAGEHLRQGAVHIAQGGEVDVELCACLGDALVEVSNVSVGAEVATTVGSSW